MQNNDEYGDDLLKELEKAKTENAQALEKEKRLMAQIEAEHELYDAFLREHGGERRP